MKILKTLSLFLLSLGLFLPSYFFTSNSIDNLVVQKANADRVSEGVIEGSSNEGANQGGCEANECSECCEGD